ncbi:hypothetical protein D9M71_735180 [compost metagenome]
MTRTAYDENPLRASVQRTLDMRKMPEFSSEAIAADEGALILWRRITYLLGWSKAPLLPFSQIKRLVYRGNNNA